jgi:hypothetical protein
LLFPWVFSWGWEGWGTKAGVNKSLPGFVVPASAPTTIQILLFYGQFKSYLSNLRAIRRSKLRHSIFSIYNSFTTIVHRCIFAPNPRIYLLESNLRPLLFKRNFSSALVLHFRPLMRCLRIRQIFSMGERSGEFPGHSR